MSDKSPDAFRTISEVAEWLGVQPHVLRFWESKFSQVKPVKRAGGRRYYRPNDMLLLGGIRKLLHEDGLTIKGAQKVLRESGMAHVSAMSQALDPESAALVEPLGSAMTQEDVEVTQEAARVVDFAPSPPQPIEPSEPVAEPDAQAEPEPVADVSASEDAAPEAEDAPGLPSFLQPEAEAPAPSDDADVEAEPEPENVDAAEPATEDLPSFLQPETPAAEPAPSEDETQTTMAFDPPAPAADPAPVAKPEPALVGPVAEAAPEIAPEAEPEPEPEASSEPTTEPEAAPEPAPVEMAEPDIEAEAEAPSDPKPVVVHAPDPDESNIATAPAALSAAYGVSKLTGPQREQLTPLVARLAAVRDRMAAARGR